VNGCSSQKPKNLAELKVIHENNGDRFDWCDATGLTADVMPIGLPNLSKHKFKSSKVH
jgi:hypothetical protein